MRLDRVMGVIALGVAFTAAAAGLLEYQNRQNRQYRSLPEPDPSNGPRSEQGRTLEKWLKYVTTYFERDDISIFEKNGRPEVIQEKAELDTRGLTRADRHIAQRLIDKLHDICEQRNFHLDISGFFNRKGEVVIEVDPSRPYKDRDRPGPRSNYAGAPTL